VVKQYYFYIIANMFAHGSIIAKHAQIHLFFSRATTLLEIDALFRFFAAYKWWLSFLTRGLGKISVTQSQEN